MAADKEVMAQIAAIEHEMPREVLSSLIEHADQSAGERSSSEFEASLSKAAAEALRQYAFQLRAQSGLWERSGARGSKSTATELTVIAQHADTLADNIVRYADSVTARLTEPDAPARPLTEWCGQRAEHGPHVWRRNEHDAASIRDCSGSHPTSLAGLDALIKDASERGAAATPADDPQPITAEAELAHEAQRVEDVPSNGDQPWLPSTEEVKAYLSGVTNDLPAAEPRGVTHRPEPSDGDRFGDALVGIMRTALADPPPAEVVMNARAIGALLPTSQLPAAPTLGQAGTNATAYDHAYVPPGGRTLTFAELMTPVPAADLPAHLSHSQIGDAGDCATQYRAQRVARLPQVPQWANVGGRTLHRCIEDAERATLTGAEMSAIDVELAWKHFFLAEIEETAKASGIPETRWRSSRKGAEGRTFWEVQGPKMLRRYLDARPDEPTAMLADPAWMGAAPVNELPRPVPAIEYAVTVGVPTPYGPIPFKAEIDRVTVIQHSREGFAEYSVKDYKSSYERPSDPTQLGRYAWALKISGAVPWEALITGQYFDARRGEWSAPVDCAAVYPWEAFVYDVATAHANKLRLTTGPTPARKSNYCGGCSVRYACPIMALGAAK